MKDQIANEVTELDKYEYNLKLEEIDKLVDQGDYEEAAELADTIDWRRVRNVRTLCLISEIYEAAGKLDKSKDMLLRAYRKSPVGRTVLYRLVEVTTALGQYDEALEYFSEYVQVAPHDNNRYILKYMIYKGRGSSPEDLIAILEEYLGQEYTERWAYELALNYQQAGQMQKCLAACDDLVLWFHSGKYVKKALDLKKKYAELTPKQQEIYENCLQEEAQEDYDEAGEPIAEDTDGDVIAENIIAETEKEIAGAVSAHKAEKDTEEEPTGEILSVIEEPVTEKEPLAEEPAAEEKAAAGGEAESAAEAEAKPIAETEAESAAEEEPAAAEEPTAAAEAESAAEAEAEPVAAELAAEAEPIAKAIEEPAAKTVEEEPAAEEETEPVEEPVEPATAEEKAVAEEEAKPTAAEAEAESIAKAIEEPAAKTVAEAEPEAAPEYAEPDADEYTEPEMEEDEEPEEEPAAEEYEEPEDTEQDDLQVELAKSVRKVISGVAHKPELNEDDVPAAVEERLRSIQETPTRKEPEPKATKLSIDDVLLAMGDKGKEVAKTVGAAGAAGAAAAAAVTGAKKKEKETEAEPEAEAEGATIKETEVSEEEETAGVIQEETEQNVQPHAMPGMTRSVAEEMTEELTEEQLEALKYSDNPGKFLRNRSSLPTYSSDEDLENTRVIANTKEEMRKTTDKEVLEAETIRIPTDEVARAYGQEISEEEDEEAAGEEAPDLEETDLNWKEQETERLMNEMAQEKAQDAQTGEEEDTEEEDLAEEDEEEEEEEYLEDALTIEPQVRGLFQGFTEVDGLEDQIANAILQAMSKGEDRTSRSGNILIFGAHGSGKTTLATEIARAIAQEKGSKVAKVARIYAADLNRKDIAATIAKIAGGTLIIEEAGDMEDKTVEQLTTAMEFRTDGLIVILEDEQRYVHELLMNHPRFTMKFTAQIYLPDYTLEELLVFGQMHANEQGYKISDEAVEVIAQKVDAAEHTDTPVTVGSMIEMVDDAIRHSNKFMRKLTMGKNRYDEENDTLLFDKDFK